MDYNPNSLQVYYMTQPIKDDISNITDLDELIIWIQNHLLEHLFPTDMLLEYQNILLEIPVSPIEDIQRRIFCLIVEVLYRNTRITNCTPWDYRQYENLLLIHLFGPPSDYLNITVHSPLGEQIYQWTEEFTYGFIIGLHNHQEFKLSLHDAPITSETFIQKFSAKEHISQCKYVIKINNGDLIYFRTPDFMQGTRNAAIWIDQDPNAVMFSVYEISQNGTFNPVCV